MRRVRAIIQIVLTISLTLGLVLSASSWSLPHDPIEPLTISAGQQAEIAEHGHSHDVIDSRSHAFHSHTPEVADHDHTVSFLLPQATSEHAALDNARWLLPSARLWQAPAFNLDKPPRG